MRPKFAQIGRAVAFQKYTNILIEYEVFNRLQIQQIKSIMELDNFQQNYLNHSHRTNIQLMIFLRQSIKFIKIKKSTLKDLIKDCCTKTVFSFNNIIYKQKNGVPMDLSLGPVLASVIMAELEKKIVKPMIKSEN